MYTFLIMLVFLLPLPLYWIFKARRKQVKIRKKNLEAKNRHYQIIKSSGLPVSSIAILSNAVMGLDYKKNRIIWTQHTNHAIRENSILFKEIRFCTVIQETDPLSGCTKKVIMKINFNTGEEPVYFTFFDDATDPVFALPARIKNAIYWKSKIQMQANRVKAGLVLEYVL